MAFHEKAGRSQVDFFFFLSAMLFSPCGVATVAMLPSALSRSDSFRSVHVGRSRFSRCCHLFGALWFCSCRVEPESNRDKKTGGGMLAAERPSVEGLFQHPRLFTTITSG